MGLVEELAGRYRESVSPKMLSSLRFWATALALVRSPLNRTSFRSDRIAMGFAVENTRDAFLRRGPVVWASLLFPSELIHGTGCVAFYPEVAAAVVASAGLSVRFLEVAEAAGLPQELCSFHRAIIGAALQDMLPRPDMMVSMSHPCDSASLSFSLLSEHYGVPHRTVEVPGSVGPGELGCAAEQLEEVGAALGGLSAGGDAGARWAGDRLPEALELSNRARDHMMEVAEARKRRPAPMDGWDALGQVAAVAVMPGTGAGVAFYRTLSSELESRGGPARAGREGHRLLWMHLKPYFANDLGEVLRENGAAVVCEEFNRCYWGELDRRRPYHSLVLKAASHPVAGTAARRAEVMVGLAREYGVDGAVHFSHRGCRQSCGCARQVADELAREGVRTLLLDGECVDPREHGPGQARTRLEAFIEML